MLVRYGETNSVDSLVDARPYLDELVAVFGDRPVRDVRASELHRFHQDVASSPAVAPLLALLDRKTQRWEAAYTLRAQGAVDCLQWESPHPVRALVEVFERPGFAPRRVLELGCGDGVNAVFMAEHGCAVTAVDLSPTALAMAHEKAARAGVELELVESDVFALDDAHAGYDFVFDRGMFHHVQVFRFDDYVDLVADRLVAGGSLHLICHHVSTRPTMLLDAIAGSVGKLLGFLSGVLVEPGSGFTADELRDIFGRRFSFESIDRVWDDNHRPLCFLSSVLQRTD